LHIVQVDQKLSKVSCVLLKSQKLNNLSKTERQIEVRPSSTFVQSYSTASLQRMEDDIIARILIKKVLNPYDGKLLF
jgi:hypothetical protein